MKDKLGLELGLVICSQEGPTLFPGTSLHTLLILNSYVGTLWWYTEFLCRITFMGLLCSLKNIVSLILWTFVQQWKDKDLNVEFHLSSLCLQYLQKSTSIHDVQLSCSLKKVSVVSLLNESALYPGIYLHMKDDSKVVRLNIMVIGKFYTTKFRPLPKTTRASRFYTISGRL